jgi:hypothetical protein
MKNLAYAIAIAAVTSLASLAASSSASPLPSGMAGNSTVSVVTSKRRAQEISWHCWKTQHYSHRLHRYLRACADTNKFKHRTSASAGLAVNHKTVKNSTSNY